MHNCCLKLKTMSLGRIAMPTSRQSREQQTPSLPARRVDAPPTGSYEPRHNQPASWRSSGGKPADKPREKQQTNQTQSDEWKTCQHTNQEDNEQSRRWLGNLIAITKLREKFRLVDPRLRKAVQRQRIIRCFRKEQMSYMGRWGELSK